MTVTVYFRDESIVLEPGSDRPLRHLGLVDLGGRDITRIEIDLER